MAVLHVSLLLLLLPCALAVGTPREELYKKKMALLSELELIDAKVKQSQHGAKASGFHAQKPYQSPPRRGRNQTVRAQLGLFDTQTKLVFQFPIKDIATNLDYLRCNSNVPDYFKGLWWLDGLVTPERVAAFSVGEWKGGAAGCKDSGVFFHTQEEKDAGTVKGPYGESAKCQGTFSLPWIDAGWAMEDTVAGEGSSVKSPMAANFVCGGPSPTSITVCKIGTPVPYPLEFFMVKAKDTDDYWIRYTPIGSGFNLYYVKRIIDCRGNPVQPYWNEFNSEGKAVPKSHVDVFGHGGDTRHNVANMGETALVREVAFCPKDTGGTCNIQSCAESRNAICQHGMCICGDSSCAQDGKCKAIAGSCPKNTGGTCTWQNCDSSRGKTTCTNGMCFCADGYCAFEGKCK